MKYQTSLQVKNEEFNSKGTPGRIWDLIDNKHLDVSKIKHFILDECDKMLEQLDMRKTVQSIFKATAREKQVMMFSATLSNEMRGVAKKFMHSVKKFF